jgi:prepilin-type N-terminal cleavage/methylation domain-containing protein/prepilin-type processing-associated H-X9-DG protein
MNHTFKARRGFSLVELLVVISVIGMLIGLLMAAVQSVRGAAARVSCTNTLRQLSLAFQHYHEQHSCFPPAYGHKDFGTRNNINWPVRLLPYVEQESLYRSTLEAYHTGVWPCINPPHVGLSTVVKVYTCPADGRLTAPITDDKGYTAAYGSYMGVAGGTRADGAMRAAVGVRLADVTDGSSNTLLLGERPPVGRLLSGNWYTIAAPDDPAVLNDPDWAGSGIDYLHVYWREGTARCRGPIRFGPGRVQNPCDSLHFWSLHSGGANFAFCDGSVRFLRYEIAPLLPDLATRAGGEVISDQ